eukprot:5377873-Ditylum_brightwellii.AAC.1
MERSALSAAELSDARVKTFSNFAVDGVPCESHHVWTSLCNFLHCKSNYVGSTDTNHSIKPWCHQIISGSDTQGCTLGKLMIDSFPLYAHVSMELWRPCDFASDHLVLQVMARSGLICCDRAFFSRKTHAEGKTTSPKIIWRNLNSQQATYASVSVNC